ncbi:Probable ubiquinone biosynthesis protein UbiB [Serratia odorifera]|uniref:Probable ubiquinone biosynthesis protein UbiB n=1 Tax=Serratia odorifera TaxID=618 RepID=A0A3S4FTB7_SEROD|nr:Probable ubiquinone biosynthesis protein UbiB [Serratia odorifera]
MLKMVLVTARDRARLAEISAVLIRYGLQDVVSLLGLNSLLGAAVGNRRDDGSQQSLPERLRAALEALGPTFVKFGQILATRSDLLEQNWTDELDRLHSQAAVLPWEALEGQIRADLGADPQQVFAEFDTQPLAAASMAQIYRARLHSGEAVVVKVLRPGLAKTIQADLRLLAYLAEVVEQQSPALARYRPRQMIRALATALSHELDLTHEGNNCDRVAQQFAAHPEVVVPEFTGSGRLNGYWFRNFYPASRRKTRSNWPMPVSTARCWHSVARRHLCVWCWNTASITPIPIPAT